MSDYKIFELGDVDLQCGCGCGARAWPTRPTGN